MDSAALHCQSCTGAAVRGSIPNFPPTSGWHSRICPGKSHVAGVNFAEIKFNHRAGQESIRVGYHASAEAVRHVGQDFPVSFGIPGHDNPGEELVTNHYVHDGPFNWTYEGRAGFSSAFSYRGPG